MDLEDQPRPGLLRRLVGAVVGLLPVPPHEEPPDPLTTDLDRLTPEERQARMTAANGRFRRGRGDGWS